MPAYTENQKTNKSLIIEAARSDPTPYTPVSLQDAFPDVAALLFRFYLPGSKSSLDHGFLAGMFKLINGPLPPPPHHTEQIMFTYLQVRLLYLSV